MRKLLGIVLCGGESKRMGSDKGLLPLGDRIWAKHIQNKLLSLEIPVVVSINPMQMLEYNKYFSKEEMIVDSAEVKGPLNGLLSVHQKYPEHDLLLLACDLIDVDAATLENLIQHYHEDSSYDLYAYKDELIQTACAIYTASELKKVDTKLTEGTLKGFSLHRIFFEEGNTLFLPLENPGVLKNYNTL